MNQESKKDNQLSLYEEELYGEIEAAELTRQLVVFSLGDEFFAVDVLNVREVLNASSITFLPNVPSHIMGIINLRGNIVSVTDLKSFLGLQTGEPSLSARIVVIENNEIATGLWTDGNTESVEIPISKIHPFALSQEDEKESYFEGQVEWMGRLIAVLKAGNIIKKTAISTS